MHKSYDLIAIDKSWVDVMLRVAALPRADEKVLAEPLGRFPGGMGGNVCAAASRLGLRTGMVSWVGDDADGRLVLDDLQRFGVDTRYVAIGSGRATNYTTVLIEPGGAKAIIIVPTAFEELLLDAALARYLSHARLVYATPYDPDQLARVAAVAHESNGLVVTDIEAVAALDQAALRQVLAAVDIAFVHDSALPGSDSPATLRELLALGPRLVVRTAGAGDALACTVDSVARRPAFDVSAVDTTGAGDCFAAAFLAAYLRQWSLDQALLYAHAAAALSIQGYGARGALPDHQQVTAFLSAHASSS